MNAKLCAVMVVAMLVGLSGPAQTEDTKQQKAERGIQVFNECDISVGPGTRPDPETAQPADPPNVIELDYRALACGDGVEGALVRIVSPVSIDFRLAGFAVTLDANTRYTLTLCGSPYGGTSTEAITAHLYGGTINPIDHHWSVNWIGSSLASSRARVALAWESSDKAWVFVERRGITVPFQLKGVSLNDNTVLIARLNSDETLRYDALFEVSMLPDTANPTILKLKLLVNKKFEFGHSKQQATIPAVPQHYDLVLWDFPAAPKARLNDYAGRKLFEYDPLETFPGASVPGDLPVVSLVPYRGPGTVGYYALTIDWKDRTVVFNIVM